jgi:hypothetical protein
LVENAFSQGQPNIQLSMGPRQTPYTVDLSSGGMQQTNIQTGFSRPVRRVVHAAAAPPAAGVGAGAFAFAMGGGAVAAASATALPSSGSATFTASTRAAAAGGGANISADEAREMAKATGWTEVTAGVDFPADLDCSVLMVPLADGARNGRDPAVRLPCHTEGASVACIFNQSTLVRALRQRPVCPTCKV